MPKTRLLRTFLCIVFTALSLPLIAQQDEIETLRHFEMRRYDQLARRLEKTIQAAEDYEVTYYKLNLTFLKAAQDFSGSSHMEFKSKIASLSSVSMNAAANLKIDSVVSNEKKLAFTHANNVLTVTLQTPAALDETVALITYYSSPYVGSAVTVKQVFNVDLNETVTSIATQSEPYDARKWWPCKDDPADKADSVDLVFTVDSDMYPVSNGLVVSDVDNGNGTRTVHWTSKYPIVTYLVCIAAAKYNYRELTFSHSGKTMPVGSWFYGMAGKDMVQHENTMLDGLKVYSDLFITYPFIDEKYGMAEYEWGGAMEHQTVSSMGFYGADVVVHELAHQWFGDMITCASFDHIWLNEGWATYCEALYREANGGLQALKAKMATTAFYGPGTIYVNDPVNNPSKIFNGNLSYNKASWVVHMVRHVVGDSAFFRAVRKYLGDHSRANYRSVKTKEFQQYLETESGKDLEPFIQNWIYGEYYPTYHFTHSVTPSGNQYTVDVNIEQMYVPQRQIFDMPIDLYFNFGNSDTTIVIHNNTQLANYQFTFDKKPVGILLDKDNWILRRVVQPVVNPTFDKGILLVNGVDWDVDTYSADLKKAYEDSVFTGNKEFTFWDIFPNPKTGYPSNLSKAVGSGQIPSDILGQYCTVVWIGNAYNGDDGVWQNTSIWEYLKAGGNVVLLTRMGYNFIYNDLQQFLGITWSQGQSRIQNCIAEQPNLIDMEFTGEQNLVLPFQTTLARPENQILFTETKSFPTPQGIGVWAKPAMIEGKPTGQMVFLTMRPYRVNRVQLKQNMQTIIDNLPCAPTTVVEASRAFPEAHTLEQSYPNPLSISTNGKATIQFSVAGSTPEFATIRVYDALGRQVTEILNGLVAPGRHVTQFNGEGLPAGMYTYRLTVGNTQASRAMLIVK